VKLVYLVGFVIKKFVTMHGHMNVNSRQTLSSLSFGNLQKNTSRPFQRFVVIYLHHPIKTSRDNAKTRQVHYVNNSSSWTTKRSLQ